MKNNGFGSQHSGCEGFHHTTVQLKCEKLTQLDMIGRFHAQDSYSVIPLSVSLYVIPLQNGGSQAVYNAVETSQC